VCVCQGCMPTGKQGDKAQGQMPQEVDTTQGSPHHGRRRHPPHPKCIFLGPLKRYLLKNSRYTKPYGACVCYKVCVYVQGASDKGYQHTMPPSPDTLVRTWWWP
jgi:hypothetical protein